MVRPTASSPDALRRMKSTRQRNTEVELRLRRILHKAGLRYRVHYPPLDNNRRRRADIVFTRLKIAVFVDGCFWHGCPKHGTWPKANAKWWRDKIEANIIRDADTSRLLKTAGWRVIRVWEHEDTRKAATRIERAVNQRRAQTTG